MIEAGLVEVRSGELDVCEVPLPGLLPSPVGIGVAVLIGPGRGAGDVMRVDASVSAASRALTV